MSQFPSQLQVCLMKKVCASGKILLECYPLLWRRATFYLNDTRCYDVAQNAATSAIGFSIWTVRASFSRSQHFSECYPPLYILCKNGVTFKMFKQTTDQWNYRKLTWGIIIQTNQSIGPPCHFKQIRALVRNAPFQTNQSIGSHCAISN